MISELLATLVVLLAATTASTTTTTTTTTAAPTSTSGQHRGNHTNSTGAPTAGPSRQRAGEPAAAGPAADDDAVAAAAVSWSSREQWPASESVVSGRGREPVEGPTSASGSSTTTVVVTTTTDQHNPIPPGPQSKQWPVYTNQFVIQVQGGEAEARKLAQKHGFVYLNHILGDYYHLEHRRLSKRSLSATQDTLNISIQDEPQVLLLERQVLKRRVKRDFLELPPPATDGDSDNDELAGRRRRQHSQLQPLMQHHQGARPANQQPQRPAPPMMVVHQQQQQLLRPAQRHPPPPLQHHNHNQHYYSRPANQPPSAPKPPATSTALGPHHHHNHAPKAPSGHESGGGSAGALAPAEGRTQELLETAASSGSLLYQQATHQAAAATVAHQRPPGNGTLTGAASQSQSSSGNATRHSDRPAPFNDPSWPLMWYLDGGAKNGFDLNVKAAWKMGYTGKGIVITILDDGLEKDHPDLQANYDPLASFDINGDDADPMPRYDVNDSNRHGTRCAGEVAAVPDNNICSIGIAYNSKVGGVRMLDGDVTDAVEARSLGLNNQHIHIYSASWGPDDNGKTVDGPGELATRAFIEGVTYGRQGLGSIFVFASGNGGREHDNCNCDGYTNSIWTLSISSATENGYVPWYIEACSSTLATTYSSGSYEERQIATTDLHHSCTSSHTGTSASAPLAAGICALVLESNPRLTWRDMQHIVVRTAKPANLVAKDWRTNALGRNVSHAFGYGLMDAAAMIHLAKRWTTVPKQYTCEVRSPPMEKFIPAKGYIELKLGAECPHVRYLEHVQSKVTLTSSRRGDLHIYLISPHGTRSTLLAQRPNDQAEQGFRNWPFMTVHSWGESPNGVWTLEVHNDGKPQNRAYFKEWTLILHGTSEDPNKHLENPTAAMPPPPPPPPLTTPAAPTAHQQQQQQHRTGGASGKPTSPGTTAAGTGSGPPPPVPPLGGAAGGTGHYAGQSPASAEFEPVQPPPAGRPGSHWSFSAPPPPPPPPLPPVSSLAPSAADKPTTVQPPTTTTSTSSSYVTTFKTIVSTSSSSSSSSQQQRPSVGHQPHLSATPVHTPMEADFEIVSPADVRRPPPPPPRPPQFGSHPPAPPVEFPDSVGASGGSPAPPLTTPATAHNGSSSMETPADADAEHVSTKPPVNQMDGNKVDLMPTKPPVGSATAPQETLGGGGANNELDANQIDWKEKESRSSGDQSLYSSSSTPLESLLATPTTAANFTAAAKTKQTSSSSAGSVLLQRNGPPTGSMGWPLLTPLVVGMLSLVVQLQLSASVRGDGANSLVR